MTEAFYEPIGPGRFRSLPATAGPWSPDAQHGGPPSALLARAIAATVVDRPELTVGRISCELLRPVPIADLDIEAEVVRPGRNVTLVDAQMQAAGEPVMLARAWLLRGAPQVTGGAVRAAGQLAPTVAPPERFTAAPTSGPQWPHSDGYLAAVQWRPTRGDFNSLGPGGVWARPQLSLVAGERLSPLQRAVMIADSGSGIGLCHDQLEVLAINVDLTVSFDRRPVGDWIHLESHTTGQPGGISYSSTVMSDGSGTRFARAEQTLLVRSGS